MKRGPVVAVGAVVLKQGALLMVQRGREPAKGQWSLPGGRVEHGEYLVDAVAREVKEETGIDIEVVELAGIFEVPGDPHFVVLDYVATAAEGAHPRPGEDAAQARWVPLDEISELDCTPRLMETLAAWEVLAAAEEDSAGSTQE